MAITGWWNANRRYNLFICERIGFDLIIRLNFLSGSCIMALRFLGVLVCLTAAVPVNAGLGSILSNAGRAGQAMREEEERMRQAQLQQLALEEANRRAVIQKMEYDRCIQLLKAGLPCPPSMLTQQTPNASANSPSNLERATNTSQQDTGDPSIRQCFYTTLRGYSFSINSRTSCRYTVKINPVTNMVYVD